MDGSQRCRRVILALRVCQAQDSRCALDPRPKLLRQSRGLKKMGGLTPRHEPYTPPAVFITTTRNSLPARVRPSSWGQQDCAPYSLVCCLQHCTLTPLSPPLRLRYASRHSIFDFEIDHINVQTARGITVFIAQALLFALTIMLLMQESIKMILHSVTAYLRDVTNIRRSAAYVLYIGSGMLEFYRESGIDRAKMATDPIPILVSISDSAIMGLYAQVRCCQCSQCAHSTATGSAHSDSMCVAGACASIISAGHRCDVHVARGTSAPPPPAPANSPPLLQWHLHLLLRIDTSLACTACAGHSLPAY